MTKMPFVGLVGYPRQCQTKHKETLDKNQIIKWIVTKLTKQRKELIKHGKMRIHTLALFLVRGVVSRVQTALPSIRIRLQNLRPGFHPIYQKKEWRVSRL